MKVLAFCHEQFFKTIRLKNVEASGGGAMRLAKDA